MIRAMPYLPGMLVPDLGVAHGMPNEVYHAGPGISKSGLDLMNESPAHYYAHTLASLRPPREEKAGQLEGTLAHCAILEPAEFDARYPVGPAVNRNTNEWKAFAESLLPGQTPIKPEQRAAAFAQAASLLRIPDVAKAVEVGSFETSAFATDPETGVLVRCRPDIVQPVGTTGCVLIDVKTFKTASPAAIGRQAGAKRYDVQAAFYSDVYALASGLEVLAFVFAFVESDYPFAASAVVLGEDSMQHGRRAYRRDLNLYARCRAANSWPGYGDAVHVVEIPDYLLRED